MIINVAKKKKKGAMPLFFGGAIMSQQLTVADTKSTLCTWKVIKPYARMQGT